jgi:hypothetical protein
MTYTSEDLIGNQKGLKIKDPAARQRAYDAYCAWLARGKTKKSFTFIEDDLMCTWQTIESYLKTFPTEFNPTKKEVAYAEGCAKWEQLVDDTGEGSNKNTSVPTLNMIMRNKYKWDTPEHHDEANESKADLKQLGSDMAAGRAERAEVQKQAPPDLPIPSAKAEVPQVDHNAKRADSDVQLPSARRFE